MGNEDFEAQVRLTEEIVDELIKEERAECGLPTDKTARKIWEMLKECTGTHFLDSGGTSGRHWQRNQGRNFEEEPATTLTYSYGDIEVTHNVYHWLKDRLTFDEDADRAYTVMQRYKRMLGHGDDSHYQDAIDFPMFYAAWRARKDETDREECEHCSATGTEPGTDEDEHGGLYVAERACVVCKGRAWTRISTLSYDNRKGFVWDGADYGLDAPAGIYGEGEPVSEYTYNVDNYLSQDIQFVYFTLGGKRGDEYVVLQIHGGADARGGFTRPVVFEISGDGELCFFDYNKAGIRCTGGMRCRVHDDCKEHPEKLGDICPGKYEGFAPGAVTTQTSLLDLGDYSDEPHDHYWLSDGGSSWGYQGGWGSGAGKKLQEYDVVYLVDDEEFAELCEENGQDECGDHVTVTDRKGDEYGTTWRRGFLYVDKREGHEGDMYCPHCGGKLSAGFW